VCSRAAKCAWRGGNFPTANKCCFSGPFAVAVENNVSLGGEYLLLNIAPEILHIAEGSFIATPEQRCCQNGTAARAPSIFITRGVQYLWPANKSDDRTKREIGAALFIWACIYVVRPAAVKMSLWHRAPFDCQTYGISIDPLV
jgi:hypothetical protein